MQCFYSQEKPPSGGVKKKDYQIFLIFVFDQFFLYTFS